jgi:hypothetical protein
VHPPFAVCRYFNFVGRGYKPIDTETQQFIVGKAIAMFEDIQSGKENAAVSTFVKRKILQPNAEKTFVVILVPAETLAQITVRCQ